MRLPSRVALRFIERADFGRFCVQLSQAQVPFSHRGFQTLVLDETEFAHLPEEPRKVFQEFKANKRVEVLPTTSAGKRPPLLTKTEAEELLWKYAKQR